MKKYAFLSLDYDLLVTLTLAYILSQVLKPQDVQEYLILFVPFPTAMFVGWVIRVSLFRRGRLRISVMAITYLSVIIAAFISSFALCGYDALFWLLVIAPAVAFAFSASMIVSD